MGLRRKKGRILYQALYVLLVVSLMIGSVAPSVQAASAPDDGSLEQSATDVIQDILSRASMVGEIEQPHLGSGVQGQGGSANLLAAAAVLPNDPMAPQQWWLGASGVLDAWDTVTANTYGSTPPQQPAPVVVAVIDGGIDVHHPDLEGKLYPEILCTSWGEIPCDDGYIEVQALGESGNGESGDEGYDEDEGTDEDPRVRGTHMAGIIAAVANNGLGIAGATGSFPVSILPLTTRNTDYTVSDAIRKATDWVGPDGERVKVILIGYGERYDANIYYLENWIDYALSEGITVIAGAGDDGLPVINSDIDRYYPASIPGVISVGAAKADGTPVASSNPGAYLLAPGENVVSTLPDGLYGARSGTQAAAAFVASAAALLRSMDPSLPAEEVRQALLLGEADGLWSMNRAVAAAAADPNDQAPPVWPEGSAMAAAATGVDYVKLEWPTVTGEAGIVRYSLYQNGSRLPGWHASPTIVSGLTGDTEYTFKVEAEDTSGNMSADGPQAVIRTHPPVITEKISVGLGGESGNGQSRYSSVSEDGRWVAFGSKASNLVEGDTNGKEDIFLRDRLNQTTLRISTAPDGNEANGDSAAPVMSTDGRYVLFTSYASNLTETPDNETSVEDLFLYDKQTGVIEKVAHEVTGGYIYAMDRAFAMSDNGRFIAFSSYHSNGVEQDGNNNWDVFIKDRWRGTVTRITDRPYDYYRYPITTRVTITPDGAFVAFESDEEDLVADDSNGREDIFVYDVENGVIERVSVSSTGEQGNSGSTSPAMSADGRFVAFASYASNLIPDDESWNLDVFVHDRLAHTTEIVSAKLNGEPSEDYNESPWISADGRYVAFHSYDDLYPNAEYLDVYMVDRTTRTLELISSSYTGYPGNSDSHKVFLSYNGKYVSFDSYALNLLSVPEAEDNQGDVYFRELPVKVNSDADAPVWPDSAALDASGTGGSYVALSWPSAEDATPGVNYRVYRDGDLLDIVPGNTYLAEGLEFNTAYSFRVEAGDRHYNWTTGGLSATAATLAAPETVAPSKVQALDSAPDLGRIKLQWTDPADPDFIGVEVSWRKSGAADYRQSRFIPKGRQHTEVIGLMNGSFYQFQAAALDADGNRSEGETITSRVSPGVQMDRISRNNEGQEANQSSYTPEMSSDGRFIVFHSDATNLVPDDTNQQADVFLYDRDHDVIQLISQTPEGLPANRGSYNPRISGDGRYVVFSSYASDLAGAEVLDNYLDIYLYDRDADEDLVMDEPGFTSMVKVSRAAQPGLDQGHSEAPSISKDGSLIAFRSGANLLPEGTNYTNLYLYETASGAMSLLTLADGTIPDAETYAPSVSGDGAFIAFATEATNLDPADADYWRDIYLYEVATKEAKWITPFPDDRESESYGPSISDDGNYVAFVYEDYDGLDYPVVYVYDRAADAMSLASVSLSGEEPDDSSAAPAISGDGRYVVYHSSADDIVDQGGNSTYDIFMYDLVTGTTKVVSRTYAGGWANGGSQFPAVSNDGALVAFRSEANDLVLGDSNFFYDVFVTVAEAAALPEWPAHAALQAVETGKTAVTLSWTPIEEGDVAQYQISYGDQTVLVPGDQTRFTITGLTSATAYTFKLEASHSSGQWTTNGPSLTVSTLDDNVPSDIRLQALEDAKVQVEWDLPQAGADIAGYLIHRRSAEEGDLIVGTLHDPAAVSYVDSVEYEKTYTYYVVAVSSSGVELPYTPETTITTPGITLQSVRYDTELSYKRYASIGGSIRVTAIGDTGLIGEGMIRYRTVTGAERTFTVALTETSKNRYEGSGALPEGTAEVISIQATLTHGSLSASAEALQNVLFVGGSLSLVLDTPYPDALNGAYLSLWSTNRNLRTGVKLTGNGTYTFTGLPSADDYAVSLVTEAGARLLDPEEHSGYHVAFGAEQEAVLAPDFPAELNLVVVDQDNQPIPDVNISIWGEQGVLRFVRSDNNGEIAAAIQGRMAGEQLLLKAVPTDEMYLEKEQTVTLVPGVNEVRVVLDEGVMLTLSGYVKDLNQSPVRNAAVTVSRVLLGKSKTVRTVTDSQGFYTLQLLSGEVTLQASIEGFGRTNEVVKVLAPGADNQADLVFQRTQPSRIQVNLYTKHIGGDWIGPMEIDWRVAVHFRLSASRPVHSSANPIIVNALVGDEVSVCVDGVESGLPKGCAATIIDEDHYGEVEIRLEESSTIAAGTLDRPILQGKWPTLKLFAIDSQGKRKQVQSRTMTEAEFELKLTASGEYEVEITSTYEHYVAQRKFSIQDGEMKDLGLILPYEVGAFSGREGNGVRMTPGEVAPGGLLQVRATYRNHDSSFVDDARILLDVPAGSNLVEGSVMLDGAEADVQENGSSLEVVLGGVSPLTGGTLLYQLRLEDEAVDQEELVVTPKIRFTQAGEAREEVLGSAKSDFQIVKLDAPELTGRRDIRVNGIAPAGSSIRVYDRETFLGETKASINGSWNLKVLLPGTGSESLHSIAATAIRGELQWTGEAKLVRFNENHPQAVNFSLQQNSGRLVTFDPGDGVAKFPYVYVPGDPFILKVDFNKPNNVKDVKVSIGGTSATATRGGAGTYTAMVQAGTGPITLSYTSTEALTFESEPPTEEELDLTTPKAVKDFSLESMQITDVSPTIQTAAMAGSVPVSGGSVSSAINFTLEKVPAYTPSSGDAAIVSSRGVPVYGASVSHSMQSDGISFSLSAYIPESELARVEGNVAGVFQDISEALAPGSANKGNNVQIASVGSVGGAILARINLAMKWNGAGNVWTGIDSLYSIVDGLGINSTLKDLEGIIDSTSRGCSPSRAEVYRQWAEDIAMQAMIFEGIKAGLMIGGVLLAPATFGWGTVGVFLATNMLGKMLDAQIAEDIDHLKAFIAQDLDCEEEKKEDRPVADPTWIYDPSGYVYEVEADNRIEGVTATIMQQDEASGGWHVWDAEWFEQINPQTTDSNGRYGWDVPEGLWKVIFEKDGFLPASSEELRVLPPHFDVNIPMVSIEPAAVSTIRALPGGSGLELYFDRHVRLDTVNDSTLTVQKTAGDQAYVEGTVEAAESVAMNGKTVTRHIRFTPNEALADGEMLKVTLDQAVLSYHDIPMGTDHEELITITLEDVTPPAAVSDIFSNGQQNSILVMWSEPADPDFATVKVSWKKAGAETFEGTQDVAKGTKWMELTGLAAGTSYEIVLAAADESGNEAVVSTLEATIAVVHKTGLQALLEAAEEVAARAARQTSETLWRHYPASAVEALNLALAAAVAVSDNAAASQPEVDEAEAALADALEIFEDSANQTAGIGDLGVMGAYYGASSDSEKWVELEMYDIDGSGGLDIVDLASIASMILE